jgi:hypothetical protein
MKEGILHGGQYTQKIMLKTQEKHHKNHAINQMPTRLKTQHTISVPTFILSETNNLKTSSKTSSKTSTKTSQKQSKTKSNENRNHFLQENAFPPKRLNFK